MSDIYILDERRPVPCHDFMQWARWFKLADRHVARTEIGVARISTVFLGLDYRLGDGPPLLFETMVFDGPHDGFQERCSTWTEAEAQHERACAMVRGDMH